jgi:hypothetical protein
VKLYINHFLRKGSEMKKTVVVIMTFCFMAGWSAAVVVDDFESYLTGLIGPTPRVASPPWTVVQSGGVASVALINQDIIGGKYLTVNATTLNNATHTVYKSITAITNTDTATTLFFRFRAGTGTPNTSIGLSTTVAPTGGTDFGLYGPQMRVNNTASVPTFNVRNGGVFTTNYNLTIGRWYNVWAVVHQNTDTLDVYLTTGSNDATVPGNILYSVPSCGFRVAAIADLVTFLIMSQGGSAPSVNNNPLDIDDININSGQSLTIPPQLRPYSPVVEQGTLSGTEIPTTLKWKAGADPAGTYAVNPAIVDEYLFMSSGIPADANMFYVGATGIDPGNTDPDSEYPVLTRFVDKTYYWTIVDAISGYAHNGTDRPLLTVGVSKLSSVDPNNLIGNGWSYESTRSYPVLVGTPPLADARVFTTDPTAVLTTTYASGTSVTATWYKDGSVITAGGDVSIINTSTSSSLVIATPVVADEGKYYCVLSNQVGTDDDRQTNTALLVIKKQLAKFDFQNDLTDTSGNGAPTGIVKTVSLADPNEMLATVVGSPSYVAGISGGQAIYLSGTQFVDFGTGGYPQAGPLNTTGDIRGLGYNKQGFGRGMDEGSILCWVKLSSAGAIGAIYSNANNNSTPILDDTHFIMSTNGTTNARILIRGENDDATNTLQALGEANGAYLMTGFDLKDGQWHMFAATWAGSTARIYINGEQVATNSQGSTEIYRAWEKANLLGASRTLAARHILADFVTGAIDSLRVYNYVIPAAEITSEYETVSSKQACLNHAFTGSTVNLDNTAGSYCVINLGDFVMIAQNWLNNGY